MLKNQPVIILGAARSGTNFLRDTLLKSNHFSSWNCDEIPAIWKYGNFNLHHDEFDNYIPNKKIVYFIKKKFVSISKGKIVLEKTCANSLRPFYVSKIFPTAKFIYIVRDGRRVVLSAEKKWKEKSNFIYLLKKLRYFPISAIPQYIKKNLEYKRLVKSKIILNKPWGPIYNGMINDLQKIEIRNICANQWTKQVNKCDNFYYKNKKNVIKIYYEDLIENYINELEKIFDFLELNFDKKKFFKLKVRQNSKLDINFNNEINLILNKNLKKHHYL